MRRTVCLLAALLVLPALGSDSPKEYDGATAENIEGTWRMVKGEFEGHPIPEVSRQFKLITFRDGRWAVSDGKNLPTGGTYRTDPRHHPAYLDKQSANGPPGNVSRLIYQVDGDTLRLAYKPSLDERPNDFIAVPEIWVFTYQRVK